MNKRLKKISPDSSQSNIPFLMAIVQSGQAPATLPEHLEKFCQNRAPLHAMPSALGCPTCHAINDTKQPQMGPGVFRQGQVKQVPWRTPAAQRREHDAASTWLGSACHAATCHLRRSIPAPFHGLFNNLTVWLYQGKMKLVFKRIHLCGHHCHWLHWCGHAWKDV